MHFPKKNRDQDLQMCIAVERKPDFFVDDQGGLSLVVSDAVFGMGPW